MPRGLSRDCSVTCGCAPSSFFVRSARNPALIASAMISDATPAATPMIEITVISEITACLRFALRYRIATKSSNFIKKKEPQNAQKAHVLLALLVVSFCSQMGEQNDVPDRCRIRQQHG